MSDDRPYVDFREVKARISIPDVLKVFGISDQFRPRGQALVGVCPFPNHQHGPRPNAHQFVIDCKKGVWLYRCFGDCSADPNGSGGGDVISFAKAMTGYSDAHVRFWFHEHFAEQLSNGKAKPKEKRPAPTKEAREVRQTPRRAESKTIQQSNVTSDAGPIKALRFCLNLDPDCEYLRKRGLTAKTIRRFGLGLCHRGSLRGYVAIPVYGYPHAAGENPLAYLGRWPGADYDENGGRPRYKWPLDFEKSRVLYGLQEAVDSTDSREPLILVEGCFSVYHLIQHGYRSAVASFGASLSDAQAKLLLSTGRPVVLMYDGGEPGRSAMRQAAAKLITQTLVKAVKLPEGVKPDNLSGDELACWLS